jgi:hypothetical protein
MIYNLRHGVPIPSADTVKNNIMETFHKNKKKLRQFFQVINIEIFFI